MKKIKHIETLQLQQMQLRERKRKLETEITSNWSDLKKSLSPANIVREAISKWFGKR